MSLEAYQGQLAEFTFSVDDLTTDSTTDDFTGVTFTMTVLGDDSAAEDYVGSLSDQTVTAQIPEADTAVMTPGLYRIYLIAAQSGVDDIMAGEDVLVVKSSV